MSRKNETLIADLIQAARECNDGDVRVILTTRAEDQPAYYGAIDIAQSHSKLVSLREVEMPDEPKEQGPTYRFPRACIKHVAYAGETYDEPLHWFVIEGNHSLTGVRISSEEFYRLNDRDNGGCWPSGFTRDDPKSYVYLKRVEFEDGIVSCDIAFDVDEINCCGDNM